MAAGVPQFGRYRTPTKTDSPQAGGSRGVRPARHGRRFLRTAAPGGARKASVAEVLGPTVRELHDTGYVHRQMHFSNFYYLEDEKRIHMMDWTTIAPIKDSDNVYLQRYSLPH